MDVKRTIVCTQVLNSVVIGYVVPLNRVRETISNQSDGIDRAGGAA